MRGAEAPAGAGARDRGVGVAAGPYVSKTAHRESPPAGGPVTEAPPARRSDSWTHDERLAGDVHERSVRPPRAKLSGTGPALRVDRQRLPCGEPAARNRVASGAK